MASLEYQACRPECHRHVSVYFKQSEFPLCKEQLAHTADGGGWELPPLSVAEEHPPPLCS